MPKLWTMLFLAGSLALAAPAEAQSRGSAKNDDIPKAYIPPPGMCRVWLDDVPAGQQPAPTDCKTALRNKPAKARVIFGDDYVDRDRKKDGPLKGFRERDKDDKDDKAGKSDKPAASKRAPWRRP